MQSSCKLRRQWTSATFLVPYCSLSYYILKCKTTRSKQQDYPAYSFSMNNQELTSKEWTKLSIWANKTTKTGMCEAKENTSNEKEDILTFAKNHFNPCPLPNKRNPENSQKILNKTQAFYTTIIQSSMIHQHNKIHEQGNHLKPNHSKGKGMTHETSNQTSAFHAWSEFIKPNK